MNVLMWRFREFYRNVALNACIDLTNITFFFPYLLKTEFQTDSRKLVKQYVSHTRAKILSFHWRALVEDLCEMTHIEMWHLKIKSDNLTILLTSLKKEKRKHLSDYLVLYVTGPRLQLSSLPLLSLGSYDNSSAIPYATQTITLMTVHHTALHCYLGIHIGTEYQILCYLLFYLYYLL